MSRCLGPCATQQPLIQAILRAATEALIGACNPALHAKAAKALSVPSFGLVHVDKNAWREDQKETLSATI